MRFLGDGVSRLENIAYSEDILATMEGMRRLGAQIEAGEHSVTIRGISGPPCVRGKSRWTVTNRFHTAVFNPALQPVRPAGGVYGEEPSAQTPAGGV